MDYNVLVKNFANQEWVMSEERQRSETFRENFKLFHRATPTSSKQSFLISCTTFDTILTTAWNGERQNTVWMGCPSFPAQLIWSNANLLRLISTRSRKNILGTLLPIVSVIKVSCVSFNIWKQTVLSLQKERHRHRSYWSNHLLRTGHQKPAKTLRFPLSRHPQICQRLLIGPKEGLAITADTLYCNKGQGNDKQMADKNSPKKLYIERRGGSKLVEEQDSEITELLCNMEGTAKIDIAKQLLFVDNIRNSIPYYLPGIDDLVFIYSACSLLMDIQNTQEQRLT